MDTSNMISHLAIPARGIKEDGAVSRQEFERREECKYKIFLYYLVSVQILIILLHDLWSGHPLLLDLTL